MSYNISPRENGWSSLWLIISHLCRASCFAHGFSGRNQEVPGVVVHSQTPQTWMQPSPSDTLWSLTCMGQLFSHGIFRDSSSSLFGLLLRLGRVGLDEGWGRRLMLAPLPPHDYSTLFGLFSLTKCGCYALEDLPESLPEISLKYDPVEKAGKQKMPCPSCRLPVKFLLLFTCL